MSGLTLNEMKENLVREREMVKSFRAGIKDSLRLQKQLRAQIRSEMQINRVVKADARAAAKVARAAARAEKIAARIAKVEARLEALKQREFVRAQKAAKKSTKGVVWSAEQIAALNTERGVA
jgi:hypothetical protein